MAGAACVVSYVLLSSKAKNRSQDSDFLFLTLTLNKKSCMLKK